MIYAPPEPVTADWPVSVLTVTPLMPDPSQVVMEPEIEGRGVDVAAKFFPDTLLVKTETLRLEGENV
jgi:hypothetical protein